MKKSAILALLFLTLPLLASAPGLDTELVYYDWVDEHGQLSGGRLELPLQPRDQLLRQGVRNVTTIVNNGPSSNRIDVVFVGDGYRSSDLNSYYQHVNNSLNDFFTSEPLDSYSAIFNVHRVDVISNESGVDHDPTYPVYRDTAMDMGFWCYDIERLLCIDVSAAYGYANNAPDVDQVLAVANSTMYGGAGYTTSELGTFAGGNEAAPEIALHEWGHSLGNLADEYFYNGDTWTKGEPDSPNASIYTASEMQSQDTKWADWIGYNSAEWDGLIDTYEGCAYCDYGIYRPTNNSKMRALGRPFNLPSAEAMIIEFYKIVQPIDDATPNTFPLSSDDVVYVDTISGDDGFQFTVSWYIDGNPIPGANGDSLDLDELDLSLGTHQLRVNVVDNTTMVRNEAARQQWMTEDIYWTVEVEVAPDGACCEEADCIITTETECNGTWLGTGTDCGGVNCDAEGIFNVPADYPTIQLAIEASINGQEIRVAPGVYTDTGAAVVDFKGKSLWIHSTGGWETTILDGQNSRPVVLLTGSEDTNTVLQGFTIRNGVSSIGGGIRCNGTPMIRDCTIRDNVGFAITGGLMSSDPNGPTLQNVAFCNNLPTNYYGNWIDEGGNTEADSCPIAGICCFGGECDDMLYQFECTSNGGDWLGSDANCDDCATDCVGDANADGLVNVNDLLVIIAGWGSPYGVDDLLLVIAGWGPCN